MIKLEKINISFDRDVIIDSNIEINDNEITLLTGDSGCGKSTLLYLLGLISSQTNYRYYMDNTLVDIEDNKVISEIKKEKFGFLFQDNSLLDSLSIKDNIIYYAHIAGNEISDNEIDDLLYLVGINSQNKESIFPKQLSGGEQQRLALACVLAKKPEYIFADEPTASLDKTNTNKIIEIFKELKNMGITIVVASHSDSFNDISDKVYEIRDKKIVNIKNVDSGIKVNLDKEKNKYNFSFKDLWSYAETSRRRNKILKGIVTLFCVLAITGFVCVSNVLDYLREINIEFTNQIADHELVVFNPTNYSENILLEPNDIIIKHDEYNKIREINKVEAVYPLYHFMHYLHVAGDERNDLIVETRGATISTNSDLYNLTILPYNKYQKVDKNLYKDFKNNSGIYISYELAQNLGINSECTIVFELPVPVISFESDMVLTDASGKPKGEPILIDLDLCELYKFELKVAGIVDYNFYNRYDANGGSVIYMPNETMDEILNEVQHQYKNKNYQELYPEYTFKEWSPKAYLVYVDSIENMKEVKSKLEKINDNFVVRNDYEDSEQLINLVTNVQSISNKVLLIVLSIIFILMGVIFVIDTLNRKREFTLLKANGLNNNELIKIIGCESLIQGTKIFCWSLLFSILISYLFSMLMMNETRLISWNIFWLVLISAFVFVALPSLICAYIITRFQPDKILRN